MSTQNVMNSQNKRENLDSDPVLEASNVHAPSGKLSQDQSSNTAASAVRSSRRSRKSASAFRTISEVANILDVQQHVLRFWETKFSQVRPLKRGGGRRYYRPEDVRLLQTIHHLLYTEGYTIKGVQKLLREQGKNQVVQENAPEAGESQSSVVHSDHSVAAKASQSQAVDDVTSQPNDNLTHKQRHQLLEALSELKDARSIIGK